MQSLNELLQDAEYIKAKEALTPLSEKFNAHRIDYACINVGEGKHWIYYSDVEGWEQKASEEFLEKVCLDLAKYEVKALTPKWWKLIARFMREYWRHKVSPRDWGEIERAQKTFDYLQEAKKNLVKEKVITISPEMIDLLCDWFKYMKGLVVKR